MTDRDASSTADYGMRCDITTPHAPHRFSDRFDEWSCDGVAAETCQCAGIGRVLAVRILQTALDEDRADELLACLFAGGSCTVDPSGHLVLVSGEVVAQMASPTDGSRAL